MNNLNHCIRGQPQPLYIVPSAVASTVSGTEEMNYTGRLLFMSMVSVWHGMWLLKNFTVQNGIYGTYLYGFLKLLCDNHSTLYPQQSPPQLVVLRRGITPVDLCLCPW